MGKRATSLERILDRAVAVDEVRPALTEHFGRIFNREMISISRAELETKLANSADGRAATEAVELKGSMA